MTAEVRRCAVLGDPVAHSLSPTLHRAGYDFLGLSWEYEAVQVPAGGLAGVVESLDGSWRGLSVTMPLKREAYALAGARTQHARVAGAVNTLVLEGSIVGHNTDLPGAMAALRERSETPVRRAALLGGGATTQSVGLALCELGATHLTVVVRDPARAGPTVQGLQQHPSSPRVEVTTFTDYVAGARGTAALAGPDVVVSTIPADAQSDEVVAAFRAAPVLFDAIYDPWPTPLAAAAGGEVVSGLDLLVHQAVLQLELFTGSPVPVGVLRAAGEAALAARRSAG